MPYFFIDDLPEPIRNHLPKKAQEIYRRAFNRVWDSYRYDYILGNETRVSLAAKASWICVKLFYKKHKSRWWVREKLDERRQILLHLYVRPKIKKKISVVSHTL